MLKRSGGGVPVSRQAHNLLRLPTAGGGVEVLGREGRLKEVMDKGSGSGSGCGSSGSGRRSNGSGCSRSSWKGEGGEAGVRKSTRK